MRNFFSIVAALVLGCGSLCAAPTQATPVDQLVADYFALRPSEAFPASLTPLANFMVKVIAVPAIWSDES